MMSSLCTSTHRPHQFKKSLKVQMSKKIFVEAYHPPLASCKLLTLVWEESYCLEKSCLQMEEPLCSEKEEHHVLQYPPS